MMKSIPFLLVAAFSFTTVCAQYRGGSGKGNCLTAAASVSLATGTMYAGGNNDGTNSYLATVVPVAANSQYAGGSDDGAGNLAAVTLPLSANTSYSGGSDDGTGAASASSIALAITSMYNGGSNDGAHAWTSTGLTLNSTSNYSGGPDDGSSALSANALDLSTQGMFTGGANDGQSALLSLAIGIVPVASMYAGGANDGFGSSSAAALSIVALPLVWEAFSVSGEGTDARLYWKVVNERNDARFEIMRSFDGVLFDQIGSVSANMSASGSSEHEYLDVDPAAYCGSECAKAFYRLKVFGLDGRFSYSPIRSLRLQSASSKVDVYPNPANDFINVVMHEMNGSASACTFSLYNSLGAKVLHSYPDNQKSYKIDCRNLPDGNYYLQILMGTQSITYQISITH